MIPYWMPPLTGLQILVTRPALQAQALTTRITQQGGAVLPLPVLTIEPVAFVAPQTHYDLLIFISTNAVHHGQAILTAQTQARLAAVGGATLQALQTLGYTVDVLPAHAANSEALLEHPLLQTPPANILLVRGVGGRELLRDTLVARGSQVTLIEVYQRVPTQLDAMQLHAVQTQLAAGELDIISITSSDILQALNAALDAPSRQLAQNCTLLLGSARLASQARELGYRGEFIIAASPEAAVMVAALAHWHTRARSELLR